MPEFKFACPQCQQQIQCDTGYAGSRINCPICQKSILVPPATAPAGESTIQIKKSTLKKAGVISLCALLAIVLVAVAIRFLGGPRTLTFKAYVDGSDVLKLSGNRLWIEHLDWQQPIKMSINGAPWDPIWINKENASPPEASGSSTLPPVVSATEPYRLSGAFKPGKPDTIKVSKHTGRGTVTIVDRPKPGNQQTVAILIDDGPMGGADWYEFAVSW